MQIHYIWLGGEIPIKYDVNYRTCINLNPGYQIIVWRDSDIDLLLTDLELDKLLPTPSPFISRYNLAKYAILHKHGGVYTDWDIKWKKSFTQIMMDVNFPAVDIVLTHPAYHRFYIDGNETNLLDDPFIISKPGLFKDCLEFSKSRDSLRIDPQTEVIHEAEPIGPFLLTEWVHAKKINVGYFNQVGYLDGNGYYGNHEQFGLWKN